MNAQIDNLKLQAQSAYQRGDLQNAESLAKRWLGLSPTDVEATIFYAAVCARTGKRAAAIVYLQNALKRDPDSWPAHIAISTLLFADGKHDQALEHGKRAIELQPREVESYLHLARDLNAHGFSDEALIYLREAADAHPHNPWVSDELAGYWSRRGNQEEVVATWERFIAEDPRDALGWLKLGSLAMAERQYDEAIRCGREAVALNPASTDARMLLAYSLIERHGTTEAEEHLRHVIRLAPDTYTAHATLGLVLQEQARFDESYPSLERAIQLCPWNGQSFHGLLRARKASSEDRPLLNRIESALQNPRANDLDKAYMLYALGKAHEDLGEYGRAMKHYDKATKHAAAFWFRGNPPNRDWYLNMVDATCKAFTADHIAAGQAHGLTSAKPLMVVGMMRSGTTLVEQILSSHPMVAGAGELTFWHDRTSSFFDHANAHIDNGGLTQAASEYLALLDRLGPEAERVTDKLPHNYSMLGFVASTFPNARIIHVRRDPVDNCLSIYTTAFNKPPEFALDRDNIVFFYQQYQRLMEHWCAVLPAGQMLEVDYEDLVANREEVTRRMIEFAGLEWDESCLHPEQNLRNVNTPSVWQVRQPIYKSSVERWRRFEPWIAPFDSLK